VLIDWFTVSAQALNFLILVWLMRRFLYKPVLDAIDARERRIAAAIADADRKQSEAVKEREEFQRKSAEFDEQRADRMTQVTDEANAERQRLLDDARQAADALGARRRVALRHDVDALNQTIGRRTQQEVFAIARQTLTDLASVGLEARMADVFTRRLREMNGETKAAFGESLTTVQDPAVVRSAFDLPAEARGDLQRAINETFAADVRLRFETAPNLISGIELTTHGHRMAWNIAEYLASMEKAIADLSDPDGVRQTEPAHARRT